MSGQAQRGFSLPGRRSHQVELRCGFRRMTHHFFGWGKGRNRLRQNQHWPRRINGAIHEAVQRGAFGTQQILVRA